MLPLPLHGQGSLLKLAAFYEVIEEVGVGF